MISKPATNLSKLIQLNDDCRAQHELGEMQVKPTWKEYACRVNSHWLFVAIYCRVHNKWVYFFVFKKYLEFLRRDVMQKEIKG